MVAFDCNVIEARLTSAGGVLAELETPYLVVLAYEHGRPVICLWRRTDEVFSGVLPAKVFCTGATLALQTCYFFTLGASAELSIPL